MRMSLDEGTAWGEKLQILRGIKEQDNSRGSWKSNSAGRNNDSSRSTGLLQSTPRESHSINTNHEGVLGSTVHRVSAQQLPHSKGTAYATLGKSVHSLPLAALGCELQANCARHSFWASASHAQPLEAAYTRSIQHDHSTQANLSRPL